MLRIQSLAFTSRSLNRRELHTCFPNTKPESPASKTSVTSLDKRDRQSLFQRTDIAISPANSAAHVSLSSHIQLSNNRPDNPVEFPQAQSPKAPNPKSAKTKPIRKPRTKDIVASSAAALVQ
jgi:hypothetical protein